MLSPDVCPAEFEIEDSRMKTKGLGQGGGKPATAGEHVSRAEGATKAPLPARWKGSDE